MDVQSVLNLVATKKQVSDVFACVATRATAADMKTVAAAKEAQVVAKEARVADTTVTVDLALADRTEALQSAAQVVKEVLEGARLEVLADVLADGNSKKVVLRKRSTNF